AAVLRRPRRAAGPGALHRGAARRSRRPRRLPCHPDRARNSMTVAPAVEIAGLTKSFGSVRALDGLDLTVPTGEVVGFLGPNGSGKSTTIRVLLGLLRADGGHVRLLGGNPWD